MGFGSYDESEQENQDLNTDNEDEKAVDKGTEYDGKLNYESEDTETLLQQFKDEVKDEAETAEDNE